MSGLRSGSTNGNTNGITNAAQPPDDAVYDAAIMENILHHALMTASHGPYASQSLAPITSSSAGYALRTHAHAPATVTTTVSALLGVNHAVAHCHR